MSEEWDLIESVEEKTMEGEEVITDICLLAKKERAPSDYLVVGTRGDVGEVRRTGRRLSSPAPVGANCGR